VTMAIFDESVETSLWHQSDYYMTLLQELTAYQQKVLHAISKENTGIFTKDYADRFYLSAGSSTQRALKSLIEKDILNKQENAFYFEDPLFRLWLIKNG